MSEDYEDTVEFLQNDRLIDELISRTGPDPGRAGKGGRPKSVQSPNVQSPNVQRPRSNGQRPKDWRKPRPEHALEANESVLIRSTKHIGRQKGDKILEPWQREAIALDKRPAQEIMKEYNVGEQTVTNIRGPRKSGLSKEFKERLEAKVQQAKIQAADKILEMFKHLSCDDKDKLSKTSLKDISTIMVNMAKITETGSQSESSDDRARVIVYAPEVKQVNNYNTVTVEE